MLDFMSIKSNKRGGYKHILYTGHRGPINSHMPVGANQGPNDGEPHFTADLFHDIAAIRDFNHHIVVPYTQWSTGGVERLNKVIEDRLAAILNSRKDPWTA